MIRIQSRLFKSTDGLSKALGEEAFTKLPPQEQVGRIGKILRENVGGDKEQSEQIINMIRANTIFAMSTKTLSDEEIMKITPFDLESLTRLSRKKVVLSRIKIHIGNHYDALSDEVKNEYISMGVDKERFVKKQVRELFKAFKGISNRITDTLFEDYDMIYDIKLFAKEFNFEDFDSDEPLYMVCQEYGGIDSMVFANLGRRFPFLKINSHKIEREIAYQDEQIGQITGNYLNRKQSNEIEFIDQRNGFINPNWFLYDIDVDFASKLWGLEKTKFIFGKYFLGGISKLDIDGGVQFPDFYNLSTFRIKIDTDAEGNKKKLVDMTQHIIEWELPSNWSQAKFSELIQNLKSVISDFRSSGEPKPFEHPIQTKLGTKRYSGYFSGSKGFENTHIIEIQPSESGKNSTLRFASEMGQDVILFVIIQVSYFLKYGKLQSLSTTWKQIYSMYNVLSMEGVERFDPSSMKSQYDLLVQKVIWPLSKEHKEQKSYIGKAHSSLLYGVYGTGKSQLLTHLLSEREYILKNGQKIHLDANVVNIGVTDFAELLIKSASTFRKRLSDIHENTGLPIILVIEDIDTIVKEVGLESDPISQAMTTLFEGVGSLPVTVIASTNNPDILPQRHLRPNRLDLLIGFPYPLNDELIENILVIHWHKKGLDKILLDIISLDKIKDEIVKKLKDFTPSHISALCLAFYERLEFEDVKQIGSKGVIKILYEEIADMPVPVNDMRTREASMLKWRNSLGTSSTQIGFLNK